ncbi:ferredoxin--NADP reductase [Gordonia sp. i37]|uniref:ferredoxin--NADP reductase n=1 Tax=Gordonia sp. i37 TaxID=1961707 RepID=UPI0009AC54E0|nr:ferredoxin--NADP reductase [Gordonia sp. i37]OPX16584.1 3-ketosteroid-9-alpha-hydroxylase [Gordonia sp. i37]
MTATAARTRELGVDLRVLRVDVETPDAISITFDVTPRSHPAFAFTAGQFLTLRIPSDRTGSVARCYSLASAPALDEHLKVAVKRTADGYASNWLCDNAATGMTLRVLPPAGLFTPRSLSEDLLLYAGGSGITPMMSIIKTALTTTERRVALFYANRDHDSVIFAGELEALVSAYPDRLHVQHWIETDEGLPTAHSVVRFPTVCGEAAEALVCGPAPFMDLVRTVLGEDARYRVRCEEFMSIDGDPFVLEITDNADDDATPLTVVLDGAETSLAWPADAKLLDVLLAEGIDAPYSCREGDCGSCMCLLREGNVEMDVTDALAEEDIADGFILACQARHPEGPIRVDFDA